MKGLEEYDMKIFMSALALTCFGLVMVYSASSVMAMTRFGDGFYFLKKQLFFMFIGMTSMVILMKIDYPVLKRWAGLILLLGFVLLLLVFVPGIGGKAKGASRWIRILGFSFQPSEFAKLSLIVFMAYSLEKNQEKLEKFVAVFIPYMVILAMMILILILQRDLGAALTLFAIAIGMLFMAGTRLHYLLSVVLLFLPFIGFMVATEGYRLRRWIAFLNPWAYRQDSGFQLIQSWIGFGNGGIFGQGLGEGKQKLFFLPEAHTDFILSVIGEELGLVAVLVVIAIFTLLVHRAIRVATGAGDTFGRFLAYGIALMIGIESLVNIAVATGLAPTKGLALPYISYGGSSLVVTLMATGILLSVSRRAKGVS